jgi:hypothetical protein
VIDIDITDQISAIQRKVGTQTAESGEVVAVLLRRTYRAAVEDV